MPLATEYKWRQTDAEVLLDVALKSASISGKDVDICDVFVKVNQSPHLLALDLFAPVDLATAVVTIDRTVKRIFIKLRKAVAVAWPDVVAARAAGESATTFEAQLIARRNDSLTRRSEYDQRIRETTATVQQDREKAALRSQMDVEQKQRDTLEAAQDLEKRRAQDEVFNAFNALNASAAATEAPCEVAPSTVAPAAAAQKSEPIVLKAAPPSAPPKKAPALQLPHESVDDVEPEEIISLPPPRTALNAPRVNIAFTPRAFPTPLRESRAKEEEDWIAKNYFKIKEARDAGRSSGPVAFIEKDPSWLRAKATDFARIGDWDSACNAFTAAAEALPNDASLYLNRAACHLHKFRAAACVEDCSTALELLLLREGDVGGRCPSEDVHVRLASWSQPSSDKNSLLLVKGLSRRLAGLALQGKFVMALADCRACCVLSSPDTDAGEQFSACCEKLVHLAEVEAMKGAADAHAKAGDTAAALSCYDAALAREPCYTVCLLNRSALFLADGRSADCIADCDRILTLLSEATETRSIEDPVHPTPVPGSELEGAVRLRATSRREQALTLQQQT